MNAHSSTHPIRELELTRSPDDRRLYVLHAIGTIRRERGIFSRSFIADAAGQSWRFVGCGFMQRVLEARAVDGTVVGRFVPRAIRRDGRLDWGARTLALRPTSAVRERYVVYDGDLDIMVIEGRGWGRRPVKVTWMQPDSGEPALVLFAVVVVHRLAVDASSAAGSIAAITASSAAYS
jgi:hypothetical protein